MQNDRNWIKSLSIFLTLVLFTSLYTDSCNGSFVSVYLKQNFNFASDLVQNGQMLSEPQLIQMQKQGIDLSQLNPVENTDYWSSKNLRRKLDNTPSVDEIFLKPVQVDYTNDVITGSGGVRLLVQTKEANPRNFIIQFSRENHQILLRKALLEKLGYQIPPVQWVKELQLNMDPVFVDAFKDDLNSKALSYASWTIKQNGGAIVLRDVLVFPASANLYQLATGYIPGAVRKTRLFNSLPIAYGLLEYPEAGLTQMPWTYGNIVEDNLITDFPQNSSNFQPNVDDSRWMAQLIGKLSRQDFVEIVSKSAFPEAVQRNYLERLISRRNSLMKRLSMNVKPLPYDKNVKSFSEPVGFADTYVSKTKNLPPLDLKQLVQYGESLIESEAITTAISQFNDRLVPHTDIKKNVQAKELAAFTKKMKHFFSTGEMKEIPFGAWAFPTAGADLILSRDVITGSYLGEKNLVQKADSFGFSAFAGAFVGFNGLPANIFANIQGKIYFNRVFTHLHPLQDIKSVFKDPFENIFVDRRKQKLVDLLEKIMAEAPGKESIDAALLKDFKNKLDECLPEGDSLIITDTLGQSLAVNIGYGFSQLAGVSAGAERLGYVIKRIHLLRVSKEQLQIYVDSGNSTGYQMGISFEALIPVINVSAKRDTSKVHVLFNSLNLNQAADGVSAAQLNALSNILKTASTKEVEALDSSFIINNKIKNREGKFSFLLFSNGSQNVDYTLEIGSKTHNARTFMRARKSKYQENDWLTLGQNIGNASLDRFLNGAIQLEIPRASYAGESLFGRSNIYDASLDCVYDDGSHTQTEPFFTSSRVIKQWNIKSKVVESHIRRINEKAGSIVLDPALLNGIKEIQFYNLSFRVLMYDEAIERAINVRANELKAIMTDQQLVDSDFWKNAAHRDEISLRDTSDAERGQYLKSHPVPSEILEFPVNAEKMAEKYKNLRARGKSRESLDALLNLLVSLDKVLNFRGLQSLLGENNLAEVPMLFGYTIGDHQDFQTIRGVLNGRLKEARPYGPIQQVIQNTQILDTEMTSTWLVRGYQ